MKKNISYHKPKKLTGWRKTSLYSWRPTGDSSCYAFEDIPVRGLLAYCKKENIKFNICIIKALSETINEKPQINSSIRLWRIYPRKENVIFFHIARSTKDDDLSGLLFREAHNKPLTELQKYYNTELEFYKNKDGQFSDSKKIQKLTPTLFTKALMRVYSFFSYDLNVHLKIFKTPKNAFGSVMLTAVGQLGIQEALTPIAPYTRVPMVVSIGKIVDKVILKNGEVKNEPYIRFGFTFDHRIMDGIHFAEFLNVFKSKFELYENL